MKATVICLARPENGASYFFGSSRECVGRFPRPSCACGAEMHLAACPKKNAAAPRGFLEVWLRCPMPCIRPPAVPAAKVGVAQMLLALGSRSRAARPVHGPSPAEGGCRPGPLARGYTPRKARRKGPSNGPTRPPDPTSQCHPTRGVLPSVEPSPKVRVSSLPSDTGAMPQKTPRRSRVFFGHPARRVSVPKADLAPGKRPIHSSEEPLFRGAFAHACVWAAACV